MNVFETWQQWSLITEIKSADPWVQVEVEEIPSWWWEWHYVHKNGMDGPKKQSIMPLDESIKAFKLVKHVYTTYTTYEIKNRNKWDSSSAEKPAEKYFWKAVLCWVRLTFT